jgi:hypothetical protein
LIFVILFLILGHVLGLGSITHVAGMSLLTLRLHLAGQNFIKKKCIFLSLGHVWQTCPNEFFDSFFADFFFCFAKQTPNDFQFFFKKNSRIILKLFMGPLHIFQPSHLIFGL